MITAIPDGRKVNIEEDDGDIRTEAFHDDNVAYYSAQAIELRNDDDGPSITLNEFKRRWEHYYARLRLTPETLAEYECCLEPIMDELGELPIDQVRDEAYAYYYRHASPDGLSALHSTMSRFSALHGVARKWGYTDEPAISVAELTASWLRKPVRS